MDELYEKVILPSLYEAGYNVCDILDYEDTDYIVTYSPLSDDCITKSAMIFKTNGNLKLLNGTVKISDKDLTSLTLTQWLRALNIGLKYYIIYIMDELEVDYIEIYSLYVYAQNRMLNIPQKYSAKCERILKKFYEHYIMDIDVLMITSLDYETTLTNRKLAKKPQIKESSTEIEHSNPNEIISANEYLKKRGFDFGLLEYYQNLDIITIVQNELYRKPCIAFHYGGDFTKCRMIFETEKQYRFRSFGKYEDFFYVRQNNSDTLYVIEGEIEALSVAEILEEGDIVAIHNTNSLPTNLSLFEKYNKIIIKIDKDRYEENKNAFNCKYSNKIIVDYKIDDDSGIDYNDLFAEKLLTQDIIKTINIYKTEEVLIYMADLLKIERELVEIQAEMKIASEQIGEIIKSGKDLETKTISITNKLLEVKDHSVDNLIFSVKKQVSAEYEEKLLQLKSDYEKLCIQHEQELINQKQDYQKEIENIKTNIPTQQPTQSVDQIKQDILSSIQPNILYKQFELKFAKGIPAALQTVIKEIEQNLLAEIKQSIVGDTK